MFESLESRRFFTITLHNGLLTIVGTADADNLYVQSYPGATTGTSDSNMLAAVENGHQQVFNFADVQAIVIQGLGGNDTITTSDTYQTGAFHPIGSNVYEAHHTAIPTTVSGGGGKDLIFANGNPSQFTGIIPATDVAPANQVLIGGNGNDTITGGNGDDVISGGAGNDSLEGLDGADTLYGQAGNDILSGDGEPPIPSSAARATTRSGAATGRTSSWVAMAMISSWGTKIPTALASANIATRSTAAPASTPPTPPPWTCSVARRPLSSTDAGQLAGLPQCVHCR